MSGADDSNGFGVCYSYFVQRYAEDAANDRQLFPRLSLSRPALLGCYRIIHAGELESSQRRLSRCRM